MRSFVLLFFPLLSHALAPSPSAKKFGVTTTTTNKFDAPPRRNPFVTAASAAAVFGVAAAPLPAFAAAGGLEMHMPHLSANLGCVLLGYGMIGNVMLGNLLTTGDAGTDTAANTMYGVDVMDATSLEQSVEVTAAVTVDATAATIDTAMEAGVDSLTSLF